MCSLTRPIALPGTNAVGQAEFLPIRSWASALFSLLKQMVTHRTLISMSQSSDLTRPRDVGSRLGLQMTLQVQISAETEGRSFAERMGVAAKGTASTSPKALRPVFMRQPSRASHSTLCAKKS